MAPEPRRTLLFDALRRAGAEFVEWEGCLWADHFGDPTREHHAVRQHVGLWDLSPLRKWEFRGPDALGAADNIFTQDLRHLEPGQIRYAPFCDGDGRMMGDATVFHVDEGRLWTFTARDEDGEHFRAAAKGFDVRVESITDEMTCLQVQGPGARDCLRRFVPDIGRLPYFRFWPEPVPLAGRSCRVARIGYSGELGYELFCPSAEAEGLWDHLLAAGGIPYGLAATETLRIEAGLILLGRDYVPHRSNPYDVSLDGLVRLEKGRFIGQEALRAIAANPPRRLITVLVEGNSDAVPPAGTPLQMEGGTVGMVTSSCWSPTFGAVLALGVVERRAAEEGGRVLLPAPTGEVPGTMKMAPMHDPERARARS
ncbi:MAG TPA: aminomethyltransferase family protein [Acidimicrobiia bacterium]|nr:aminomethyltransferase family protein [Acidimicrobiia bacterium]